MKKYLFLVVTIVLSLAIVGCSTKQSSTSGSSSGSDGASSGSKKVLHLNNGNEPTSFDPAQGFDAVSWNALNNLMEGLVRLGKDNNPEPAMAEKWDISDDGKTYTFHIRSNAKWSNGDDVTAGDFEYAWKRMLDPKTASPAAFLGNSIAGAEAYNSGKGSADDVKVKANDDKTLEVTLANPDAAFLNIITNPCFFPIDKKVADKDANWFKEAKTFVGNGPFTLKDWQHNSKMVMEKNKNYWDADTVKLDEVDWAMVNDSNTEYQMFQSGDLDQADVPADLSAQLVKQGKVTVSPEAGIEFYRFNTKMEPFQNEKIRKAFALAVDQEELVKYVIKSQEKPAHAFVSPGLPDADGKDFRAQGKDYNKYDANEAKKLLKEGMAEEGYKTLPQVTLTYNTDDTNKKVAEALQQKFKEVLGVNVKLANMEWNVFSDQQKALKLQFSRSSFINDYADPLNSLISFTTDSSMNRTGWSNKKYDQLIDQAGKETDEAKRSQDLHQAEDILFDEAPIVPIKYYDYEYLQKDNVKDVIRHPVGYLDLKWADIK
ncbi:dipeptide transport system substrate-binding protein [Pullulanibacillus pueri]|uniref:Dipeptide-binding protein DppE n=1 Tax=Pullulanibacillus pueri TaxID=1437324 RepID=A0A8J2ZRS8_9BACL|nr:peptide ABC transporter substrate-binding protein [Pullulanibacillus pueri]MBM7679979.1 dipeptide transport system substrate-binding protein [Pullulanibacillus pueri]GGH73772.1 dipeptide-binding protein DppE [Pullulanibacillus pueri]